MEKHQINYLKDLLKRLSSHGFSWQHDDFYKLKQILPETLNILTADPKFPQSSAGSQERMA